MVTFVVKILLTIASLLLCGSVGANNESSQLAPWADDPRFDARVSELLAKNMLQLSQEIGTTILQDSDKATEVFSPLSIYTALSILLMGSNGQTFQELMSLLKINNDAFLSQNTWKVHEEFSLMIDDLSRDIPHSGRKRHQAFWKTQRNPINRDNQESYSRQQISVANGIFFQNGYSVRPDYRSAMESAYNATLQRLDFANKPELSTTYINSWITEKTEGKIKEIISGPLPASTKAIIASALYFKALWAKNFMQGGTQPKEFFPDGVDRPSITVDMMATGGSYPYYDSKEYDCRIIGLPYRKHLTTMYIILPNNSTRNRLRQFQATLTADKIEEMISKMEWKTAIILFPKLHITNRVDLKMILNRMGLRSLFNYEQSDLSLMSTGVETLYQPNTGNSIDDKEFLFTRIGEQETKHRNTTAATPTQTNRNDETKRGKRSVVTYKAIGRSRRELQVDPSLSLKRLDLLRTRLNSDRYQNPRLFADELIHQIDLTVNEVGTEGGAATITTLRRSGPDVFFRAETPFLFMIRHEDTKLPIFYGAVFEPTNN